MIIAAALLSITATSACVGPASSEANRLADDHPARLFQMAVACERAARRDDAVFWFYLGQLRYRAYLRAHPDIEPSGDPALFASLMATVGPSINGYAFGDIGAFRRTIARVLSWDDDHADRLTPKAEFAIERAATRKGLRDLSDTIAREADAIAHERTKHGLKNR